MLFCYPKSAAVGHVLPVRKFFEYPEISSVMKKSFVRHIEKIIWAYKLSPETTNIPETSAVPELQIFCLELKEGEIKQDLLRCIDRVIPSPILFELFFDGRVKVVAAYKCFKERVVGEYFESPWMQISTLREPLPTACNLEELYSQLLSPLMIAPSRVHEEFRAYVKRCELICATQRKIKTCESVLRREVQFNRKVSINSRLHELKKRLEELISPLVEVVF